MMECFQIQTLNRVVKENALFFINRRSGTRNMAAIAIAIHLNMSLNHLDKHLRNSLILNK